MSQSSLAKALFSLVLVSFLALHAVGAQQRCNDDLIMNTNGGWKKLSDENWKYRASDPVAEPVRLQMLARIDQFAQLLRAAYPEPKGIGAGWQRSRGDTPLVKDGPLPYQLTGMFLEYYCNNNMPGAPLTLGDETGTWFYVWANQLNWFVEGGMFFTVGNNRVFFLTKKVGEFKGYPLYEGIHNGTTNGTTYSRAIIITRPGQSPYVPVTKREFLRVYVTHNERMKAEGLAALTAGVTDQQQREESLRRVAKSYDDDMKPAQDLLSKFSEEELKQPAIIDHGEYGGGFKAFTTEENGGRMLMRVNPTYFDAKLPRSVPQLLIVYWRWDKGKPGENFKNQLEANFDFTALQKMIDH